MGKTTIPLETIIELRSLLSGLPNRSSARRSLILETAELYGVSPETVYRNLRHYNLPRSARRADHGQPRVMPKQDLLRYCEVIAALKIRTSNGQGRHLSTAEAIRLLEEHGIIQIMVIYKHQPDYSKKRQSIVISNNGDTTKRDYRDNLQQ